MRRLALLAALLAMPVSAQEAASTVEVAVLARDVAKQIEEELTYPGQIRVTVVRESRATEVAR